jgi:hypothetical protein
MPSARRFCLRQQQSGEDYHWRTHCFPKRPIPRHGDSNCLLACLWIDLIAFFLPRFSMVGHETVGSMRRARPNCLVADHLGRKAG